MTNFRTIYDFTLEGIDGKPITFKHFKGKKILIVNTASECGYTSQYAQLQELHYFFGDKLVIVGCPSNDFGNQEPGSNEEIAAFCQTNFKVEFPMSKKIKVAGEGKHPLYKWLSTQNYHKEVSWNFQKFLFNEEGKLMDVVSPATEPLSADMLSLIQLPC
ncbi:MAG: glutathione peroxidase [Sphingobacteriales bacterium]|nr:MAG: glutathione peroxidase [Sphingobacteriales bacterium]